jgi:agmatinase
MGIPYDENSSFLLGPALAPARIREALLSGASNLFTEDGLDLGSVDRLRDLGDLKLDRGDRARGQIESRVSDVLAKGGRLLSLGGDHAITYPILRAYAAAYADLTVLHLDAHPDLYDELHGNRYSHACPFARVMEEGLATRLVQVGIRGMTSHQREQAERFGVTVVEARSWGSALSLEFRGPVYLSLDLDVLDPAFAPGVAHHEPGGLSTRQVLQLIQGMRATLVGADIVELNPHRDLVGVTAAVAAKLVKEVAARLLRPGPISAPV